MNFKKILNMLIILLIGIASNKTTIFNEPLMLYLLYVVVFKNRYFIFLTNSILYILYDINLFCKNSILFIMFEIVLILLSSNKNINKKAKYRMFMLTFFCYLVLINIFEPMVYNYVRLLESIYLYIFTFMFYKISFFSKQINRKE